MCSQKLKRKTAFLMRSFLFCKNQPDCLFFCFLYFFGPNQSQKPVITIAESPKPKTFMLISLKKSEMMLPS